MAQAHQAPILATPEDFTVEVGGELSPYTLHNRSRAVNALLRLAMLAGWESPSRGADSSDLVLLLDRQRQEVLA